MSYKLSADSKHQEREEKYESKSGNYISHIPYTGIA